MDTTPHPDSGDLTAHITDPAEAPRPPGPLHGRDLVDHLFPFRTVDPVVAQTMAGLRADFWSLGLRVADETPPGPDQDVAIRALADACQATIANLARNSPDSTVD